ncbi:LysR family transcriptional regulator [Novosphingobium sp. FSW06-99]|uniref:LysR family transcriptional regulator n=1 Tax=Novosphingobium sp. FSW06-99 TaxID=1739113 RepID=UPI00076D6AEE|nr:LysR family transcriptional regulator [Novosphingobium sp. FSW06-99]KUR80539.1 LysR family transcriptional regulator [Novosphingobium sp. FSW06-99]
MIDATDYELFARIAELGSISAAANTLGLSVPMASKRLARLEARLGTRLINRSTRRIVLTTTGAQFRDDVVAILDAIQQAEERLAGTMQRLSGPVRISAPTSFGRLHVAPYLKPFLDAHPGVDLELTLTDAFVDLLQDGVDLAVRIAGPPPAALQANVLAPNRRILCAAPAYLHAHGTPETLKDLHQHKTLAAQGQSPWRLSGPDGNLAFDVKPVVRTNSSEVVREMALAGMGVALRSLWDVNADLAAGRLVRVLDAWQGMAGIDIMAVHLRRPELPRRVTAFIDHLRRLYHPAPPWE